MALIETEETDRGGRTTRRRRSPPAAVVRVSPPCRPSHLLEVRPQSTPTFAITEYKIHGKTLEEAYVSLAGRYASSSGADFMSTYVQLSRVVSLAGLHLLAPIDARHYVNLRIPFRIKQGLDRIHQLEKETLERYHRGEYANLT